MSGTKYNNQKNEENKIEKDDKTGKNREIIKYGSTFYSGKYQPLKQCMDVATKKNHELIIACDYPLGDKSTKIFGSYKNAKTFWKKTKNETDKAFYVIIPDNTPCTLYADLEWGLNWKTEAQIKEKFLEIVQETLALAGYHSDEEDFLFASASQAETNKGSMHVHAPTIVFDNVQEQQKFFNSVRFALVKQSEWYFVDETDKNYIIKTFIDFGVYNKNRQMRLPYSGKLKNGKIVRPLIPEDEEDFDMSEWVITDVSQFEGNVVDVKKLQGTEFKPKREQWNKELLQGLCDAKQLEVSIDSLRGSLIILKNKGAIRKCPIGGEENESDNAFLTIKGNKIFFHCHNEECKGKHAKIYEKENEQELFDEIPWEKWERAFNECKPEDLVEFSNFFNNWKNSMVEDINNYCVKINGGGSPYILLRRVKYVKNKKLGTREKIVYWQAVKYAQAGELVCEYQVHTDPLAKKYKKIINIWKDHKRAKKKLEEDCMPTAEGEELPDHVFNTFQGLAITKEKAILHGKEDPTNILNFIKKTWCNGDEGLFEWVICWFAHLIQRPWIKMKTSIVISGLEGTGKGMIIQILGKIIGEHHYFQPGSPDDIFGSFNYLLDNRLLVFADEMFWGGDKKKTGQLKTLLTEETRTSNQKYAPQRKTTNMINWIFASNEDWVIPAGTRARRYTVLSIKDDLYKMTEQQKKELYDFCPYSFAKYLYSKNLDNFNPHKMYQTEALMVQKTLSAKPIENFMLEYIDDDEAVFGTWVPSNELHGIYKERTMDAHKMNSSRFSVALSKTFGFERDRKTVGGIRQRCFNIPPRKEVMRKINDLYGCNFLDVEEDSDNEPDEDQPFFN